MNNRPNDRLEAAFEAARDAAIPTTDQQARAREQFLKEVRGVSLNGDMRLNDQTRALSDPNPIEGERRMKRLISPRKRLIAAVLLGVLLATGFWTSPSLRALAQEIIDFFTPNASDNTPGSVFVGGELHEEANPYPLSLDELASQANFDVRVPTFIPETYHFVGALYQGEYQYVTLMYECTAPWSVMITQRHSDDPAPPMEVGASAVIEDVPIRDTVGQYVRGAWLYVLDQPTIETPSAERREVSAKREWTNESEWQQLFWREDGIDFAVATAGGIVDRDVETPCALTKEDYVAIAQGLQPAS